MAQEKWLVDGEKVIDVEMIRSLKVTLIGGQVDIVGHDEPGARVEVHSVRGKALKVSVDGGTLEIDHPQLSWDNFIDVFASFRGGSSADVSIMVPRDVALKFGVVTATALISGLTGDARISTVSGDITVDEHRGDLELNAVSGEIAVRGQHGKISAHTVSGDITASGEIERFTSEGVSGRVFLDIVGTPDEVRVSTVSGSVTARLEPELPTQYRINTVSGRLQLDDQAVTGVRGSYTGKFGTLDKNWLAFKANTVSGNVSVLHTVRA
ncbi:MAG TPA: DUF4097 family beta strand repeat-containing protein [Lacisediminihabitans sp.]|uniref:DUF4097 family beta strand repeat-containing protein n=1 Tax=Lacisediminihabitans sp. TaxID=2787631 RepID=UPI002ED79F87